MFWFEQSMDLPENKAKLARLAINLGNYGNYVAYTLTSVAVIILLTGIVLTITKKWQRTPSEDEVSIAT